MNWLPILIRIGVSVHLYFLKRGSKNVAFVISSCTFVFRYLSSKSFIIAPFAISILEHVVVDALQNDMDIKQSGKPRTGHAFVLICHV